MLATFVTGHSKIRLFAHPETQLDKAHKATLNELLNRRLNGEPLAYLTGVREFWSMPLIVAPGVLVPRPDTETLIEKAIELIPGTPDGNIVELGTGSGAIAIALANEIPSRSVIAIERSAAALRIAAVNIERCAQQAVHLVHSSWLDSIGADSAAAIISNPPYLPADDPHLPDLTFEPQAALVSGESGLDDIEHIIKDARRAGKEGCLVMLEHGCEQGLAVRTMMTKYGYIDVNTSRDLAGLERISYGYAMDIKT